MQTFPKLFPLLCALTVSVALMHCSGSGGSSSGGGSGATGGGTASSGGGKASGGGTASSGGGTASSGGGTASSGGGTASSGGGTASSGGGTASSGGGTASSGGGTASSGGGTASSGGGTASSGGGTASSGGGTGVVTCTSTSSLTTFNPADPFNAFYVEDSYHHAESWSPARTDGGTYDVLVQEMYYFNNPTVPGPSTLAPTTYVDCDYCFYLSRGCPVDGDPAFDCTEYYLAQGGSTNILRADLDAGVGQGVFTATGDNLHFVQWDFDNDVAMASPKCIDVPKYLVDAGF